VELAVTEHNSVYSNPGKQTTSLVNGLFYADAVGTLLKTEFNAMLWWDLRNGQEAGNNNSPTLYGWRRYGDYGIVNATIPPGPADRYPTFYVNKLLKYFARGGEKVVQASSDYQGLGVYAVKGTEHSLRILVINKASFRGAEYHHLHPRAEEGRDGKALQLRNRAGRSGAFRRWFRRYSAIDTHAAGIDADLLTRPLLRPRDPDQQARAEPARPERRLLG
jgi:hypothetical protein